jgi:MFS family permease
MKSGFAFLPFSLGIIAGAAAASRLLPRFGPRTVMSVGLLLGAVGLGLFTTLDLQSSYWSTVLPAEIIVSFGMGLSFVSMSSTALIGIRPEDAGVASALVNATQQTGGSMGAALINTIATTATASYLATHGKSAEAVAAGAVHGYTTAFTFSAIVLAAASLTAFALIRRARAGDADLAPTDVISADGLSGDGIEPPTDEPIALVNA